MGGLLSEGSPPPQKLLQQVGEVFIPEIFSRRKIPTKRLGPTAWLDGLRGWAALCVTCVHLTAFTHDGLESCYGAKYFHNDEHNTSPAALPILRLPFSGGHFVVMIFFVISGYVVPRRLLQHLQEGRTHDFIDDLQSAVVRRPFRLILPVLISTFVVFVSWHVLGIKSPSFPKKDNILLEFWSWVEQSSAFSYFYRFGWLFTYYNVHTWTIPVELRGSMFLFTYLFAAHTLGNRSRILITLLMILHLSIGSGGAWYACFFGGMFLCELDLLAASGKNVALPWNRLDQWLRSRKPIRLFVLHVILLIALYLGTQPSSEQYTRAETIGNCPGWMTLSSMIPKSYYDADSQFRWFWLFWGSWFLVYAVREIDWLRKLFETQTAQYLGRHSFALYLIHGPMITTFSQYLFYLTGVQQAYSDELKERFGWLQNKWYDAPWWPFPSGGPAGLEPNFLFCVAVSIPIYLYVAEIGTRLFDVPGLKASRWIWQKWKTL